MSQRLGKTLHALDSSTVVRLRANKQRSALLGKGYCQRAQRAVQANLVAALTTVVLIGGVRVGLVRRTRLGATCQEAVANIFADLPESAEKRLFSVDAGAVPPLSSVGLPPHGMRWWGACARTSRCAVPLTPSPPESAVAQPGMGR